VNEYDQIGFAAGFGKGEGFDIVELYTVAEFAESVSQAIWTLLEVPKGVSS
jgi:hypothetical protein